MDRTRAAVALLVVVALATGVYVFVIDVHLERGDLSDPVFTYGYAEENGTAFVRHTGGGAIGVGEAVLVTVNGDREGVVLARNGSIVSHDGTWIPRDSDAVVTVDDRVRVRGVADEDTVRVVVRSEEGRRVVAKFTV